MSPPRTRAATPKKRRNPDPPRRAQAERRAETTPRKARRTQAERRAETTPRKARRTQAERRAETTARLIDATIEALAACGYSGTTVSAICSRAGVSQGALFRYFPTRLDVIAKATDAIGERHMALFEQADVEMPAAEKIALLVALIQQAVRTPTHAAWHEVMVAARTDAALRRHVREPLQRFEAALLGAASKHLGVPTERAEHLGMVLLSVMHMFDSEAVTVRVLQNAPIEQARVEWATALLMAELAD